MHHFWKKGGSSSTAPDPVEDEGIHVSSPTRRTRRYAKYPPQVESVELLGYIKDCNDVRYSRDIGRSSKFGCFYVFQFGDTFSFNRAGEYVGMTDNTCAVIPEQSQPTNCLYNSFESSGKACALVPNTPDEVVPGDRQFKLWSFGGILEEHRGSGSGWVYYEKIECISKTEFPHGTGLAKLFINDSGQMCANRTPNLLFDANEPRFGVFSVMNENGYFYLWGNHGADILLARVKHSDIQERSAYEFWNGEGWVPDWHNATPVMDHMQHGAIYRSSLFGPGQGAQYVFIGVSSWADSQVIMGVAAQREGPFEFRNLFEAQGLDHKEGYKYCIYPHPWAFNEEQSELMVTWSEHWPGGVVAAKVKFEMTEPWYHKTMPINYLRQSIINELPYGEALIHTVWIRRVNIEVRGRCYTPGIASCAGQEDSLYLWVEGSSWHDVEIAVILIRQAIKRLEAAEDGKEIEDDYTVTASEEAEQQQEQEQQEKRTSASARLLRRLKGLARHSSTK